jgi:hypothetical protein
MILHLATSCFPNCHPAGTSPDQLQQSGNMALGLAFFGLIALLLMSRKGRGK